jgi:hypothetical protein
VPVGWEAAIPTTLEESEVTQDEADADDGIKARVRKSFELFVDVLEQRGIERNLTPAEVLSKFEETELFDPVVDMVEAAILDRQSEFAAEVAEFRQGFAERMRVNYAEACDGFQGFVSICA